MLNEYILFEKYMQVLYEFGERHLSRTRNRILTDDLRTITLSTMESDLFITLKFCSPDWKEIETSIQPAHDNETQNLVRILMQPYGALFNYNLSWAFEKLKAFCVAEEIEIPDPDAI